MTEEEGPDPVVDIAKVNRMLAAAADLLPRGHAEPLVACLYDACLHPGLALLAADGIEASTHRGVRNLLALHLVKEGRLPRPFSRDFARLLADRDLAHYGTAEEFEGDVVLDTVALAVAILRPALAVVADLAPTTAAQAARAGALLDTLLELRAA